MLETGRIRRLNSVGHGRYIIVFEGRNQSVLPEESVHPGVKVKDTTTEPRNAKQLPIMLGKNAGPIDRIAAVEGNCDIP